MIARKKRETMVFLNPKRTLKATHHVEVNNMASPTQRVVGKVESNLFITRGLLNTPQN